MTMVSTLKTRLRKKEKGQGIVEYAFIIAFVSLLVVLCFGFANGTLATALSQAHSRMVSEFNRMNDATERFNQGTP